MNLNGPEKKIGRDKTGKIALLTDSFGKFEVGRIIKDADKAKLCLFATVAATVAIFISILIFIAFNSLNAMGEVGVWEFLTGESWKPGSGSYGASSLIVGTFLVTGGAMLFSVPMGIGIAIYINDVASPRMRNILKPVCELFAGIPSVVYGFLGLMILVPLLIDIFPTHLSYGTSWLAGSLVLGIMALPTIISVSHDAISAVPRSYVEASVALGATRWETMRKVVMKSAISGICAAIILGIGRALGETIAVMMVTGNSASIPEPLWNIFEGVRTITASIALEMPEVAYGSLHFSSLFMLALILMVMVLVVNISARKIVASTKRKMGQTSGDKARSKNMVTQIFDKYRATIIKFISVGTLFAFASTMSSLFIGVADGLILGIIVSALFLTSGRFSRYIGSKNVQKLIYSGLTVTVAIALIILVAMVGIIVVNGAPAISLDFIFSAPSKGGVEGGIWPAIVGTIELMLGTAAIAIPPGICAGIYLSQYAKDSKMTSIVRQTIYSMSGMPSIVFGLFGMSVLVVGLGLGYTLIGGCITLALMVLPTIIKTTEEAVSAVPREINEAAMALGSSKWQATSKVVLPAAMVGVLTGIILSIGRAAGETAPVMFTAAVAFKTATGVSLLEPIMALPYHLYYLTAEVPAATTNQYGTALVLMMIVIGLFALVSFIRFRYSKKQGW